MVDYYFALASFAGVRGLSSFLDESKIFLTSDEKDFFLCVI